MRIIMFLVQRLLIALDYISSSTLIKKIFYFLIVSMFLHKLS